MLEDFLASAIHHIALPFVHTIRRHYPFEVLVSHLELLFIIWVTIFEQWASKSRNMVSLR